MTISIPCLCPMCGATTVVECDARSAQKYMEGALIQEAFPDMDIHARETLISGMCAPCQFIYFEVEDEDCDGECDVCCDFDCPSNASLFNPYSDEE